jgi:hypothetical protein
MAFFLLLGRTMSLTPGFSTEIMGFLWELIDAWKMTITVPVFVSF